MPDDYDDLHERPRRVPLDGWEVLAFGVLVALGLVVAGGFVAGIVRGTEQLPLGPSITWSAVAFGSSWASPYFAAVLLAVLGTSWWCRRKWAGTTESAESADADTHIERARRLKVGVQIGLLLVAVAAVLGLVASAEENAGSFQGTSTDLSAGFDTVAVLLLVGVGLWVAAWMNPWDPRVSPGGEPQQ